MHIKLVIFFLWLLFVRDVSAQTSAHMLFAVDLSLDTASREIAFDVIKEVSVNASESTQVGLTLFDDTVRLYVAPGPLDAAQKESLNQAMSDPPPSVNGTSNLAVGIERAIDRFTPDSTAVLVVFTRGVIDTETQDPRARFTEWLEHILLPQATEANTAISLVVSNTVIVSAQMTEIFSTSDAHQIMVFEVGQPLNSGLVSILGIQNRTFGKTSTQIAVVAETISTPINAEELSSFKTESLDLWQSNKSLITRLVLLFLASTVLIVLVVWYFRAKPKTQNLEQTDISSTSTYLPLTNKPSRTMSHRSSTRNESEAGQPSKTPTTSWPSSNNNDSFATSDEPDPWEK